MAIVQRVLQGSGGSKVLILHTTITDADVTDSVIYDNSAFVNNVNKGSLVRYWISGSDCLVNLEWDQTTDSPVLMVNPINTPSVDFSCFGGVHNPNGTGATGDLLVTTTGLAAGEAITIILWINQN